MEGWTARGSTTRRHNRRVVLGALRSSAIPVEDPKMTQAIWGPVQQEMSDLLKRHPDDVPGVVDQLTKLQEVLCRVPPLMNSNPLADFNQHYLAITENVLDRLYAG